MIDRSKLDEFTLAYIECMLWSTNDESTPDGGRPMDDNYSIEDIEDETLERIVADCEKFQKENEEDLKHRGLEHGGHDFWLTREGHGAGFWDGDWPKDVGERLTEASKKFGETWIYVGDNGKIDGHE